MEPVNEEVITGTLAALSEAVRVLIAEIPRESPTHSKLRTARDRQEHAMRALARSEAALFALERAWEKMLGA